MHEAICRLFTVERQAALSGFLSEHHSLWASVQALAHQACVQAGVEAVKLGDTLRETAALVDAIGATFFGPEQGPLWWSTSPPSQTRMGRSAGDLAATVCPTRTAVPESSVLST